MTEGEILAAEMVVTVGMVRLMGSRQGVKPCELGSFHSSCGEREREERGSCRFRKGSMRYKRQ